jgi:N-acetyl sugar amidotransferase
MLTYCVRCVMPSTRPDLVLDADGVCNACRSYEARERIDWADRRAQLLAILDRHRRHGSHWDCIVPVSGGKDSTYQVIRMLELGMNPLCVTGTTCHLSELGKRNIENIKRLGVDHVQFSGNPSVRAKLNRIGLTEVGDISWPEHVFIVSTVARAAVQFNVPLIIWGENSQNEYGGPAADAANNVKTRRWLEEFGGLLGLRVSDMSATYGIEPKHLLSYQYPSDDDLRRVGVTGIFLGYYIPWDGLQNALISQAHGFESLGVAVEGSMVDYENLDNYQTGVHDYFKFLKFGFSRASDIASLHVRRGRITRDDALRIVRARDGQFPWTYLGKPLKEILDPLEISIDEFIRICDRFTNKKIFKTDASGALLKDRQGNLEKINYDNVPAPDGVPRPGRVAV